VFWHITKREIYDNMTSLRFGFTLILLVSLMVMNAVIFVRKDYQESVEQYREKTSESLAKLRTNCSSLYKLMTEGPGDMHKEPSPLTFCADGEEENMPNMVYVKAGQPTNLSGSLRVTGPGLTGEIEKSYQYSFRRLWRVEYSSFNLNQFNIMPGYLKADWAFIIGVLTSFVSILFTFDAVSGEKERGTLRLVLAGAVPRSSVILGKFAGAFVSIILPLIMAILLNLLIINISGAVQLNAIHWGRIGVMVLISVIYASVFIGLGLFVSACFSRSRTSLLVLLLIWVIFVVLMPGILGSISSGLKEVPSMDEFDWRKQLALEYDDWQGHWDRVSGKGVPSLPSRENPDMEVMNLWAEYMVENRQAEERIRDEHLNAQMAQVQLARQITRISPTAIYRYALENLSNTGYERHRKFIASVWAYRDSLWEYIKSEDRKDPDSLHIYFVREGMSDKPPNFDNAPRFTENLTLAGALQDALLDILILSLLAVLFFMAAYISFMRADVR